MTDILCFGDSNTWGYDPRSYLGSRYPADVRWTGRLRAAGFKVTNEGENGRAFPAPEESPALAGRLLRAPAPELLIVLLGTNDLLLGASAAETAEKAAAFLSALRAASCGTRLLLIAPPPLARGEWVREARVLAESRLLADALRGAARRARVPFADAGAWGVSPAFDGVHFSPDGHRAFAEGLLPLLRGEAPQDPQTSPV